RGFTATRVGQTAWHGRCQCVRRSLKKLRGGRGNGGCVGHRKTERSDRQTKQQAEGDGATGAASSPLAYFCCNQNSASSASLTSRTPITSMPSSYSSPTRLPCGMTQRRKPMA